MTMNTGIVMIMGIVMGTIMVMAIPIQSPANRAFWSPSG
jgi:hypothetical protein